MSSILFSLIASYSLDSASTVGLALKSSLKSAKPVSISKFSLRKFSISLSAEPNLDASFNNW